MMRLRNKILEDVYWHICIKMASEMNISIKKKKYPTKVGLKATVAQMVKHFFPETNMYKGNKYIKFSNNHNKVGETSAAVVLMVRRSPDKRNLLPRRVPGSNPGSGVSPTFFSKRRLNNI